MYMCMRTTCEWIYMYIFYIYRYLVINNTIVLHISYKCMHRRCKYRYEHIHVPTNTVYGLHI